MPTNLIELTSSRANPLIDPAMHVWGWEIPVYLFLGGLVAGMMILTGFFVVRGDLRRAECTCRRLPFLGLALLSAGMLALFLDLEHKLFVWRLYTTFEPTSPMSWGSWILVFVYPALLASALLRPPEALVTLVPALGRWSDRLVERPNAVRRIGVANMVLGTGLGIYTGVLLSALGARPLWSSGLLGPLFLLSGLSSGAALVHLIARDPEERELLARADIAFLGAELAVIGLFLIGLVTSTKAHLEAASLVLGGPYTMVFWVFVVGLGIVLPLVVQPLAVRHRIPHTPVAPLLVLLGGFLLRVVFVSAGQASHWHPW